MSVRFDASVQHGMTAFTFLKQTLLKTLKTFDSNVNMNRLRSGRLTEFQMMKFVLYSRCCKGKIYSRIQCQNECKTPYEKAI